MVISKKIFIIAMTFCSYVIIAHSDSDSLFLSSPSCSEVKEIIAESRNKYIVDGLEVGVLCFENGKISDWELRKLIENRLSGITNRNKNALEDMNIQIGSYVLGEADESEKSIGMELLAHAINQKVESKGRYEFLLAAQFMGECCDNNKTEMLDLLKASARKNNILAVALLMYIYQGNSCVEEDSELYTKYEGEFAVLGAEENISFDTVIEYLNKKGLLPGRRLVPNG